MHTPAPALDLGVHGKEPRVSGRISVYLRGRYVFAFYEANQIRYCRFEMTSFFVAEKVFFTDCPQSTCEGNSGFTHNREFGFPKKHVL